MHATNNIWPGVQSRVRIDFAGLVWQSGGRNLRRILFSTFSSITFYCFAALWFAFMLGDAFGSDLLLLKHIIAYFVEEAEEATGVLGS